MTSCIHCVTHACRQASCPKLLKMCCKIFIHLLFMQAKGLLLKLTTALDNIVAVYWQHKAATMTSGAVAYILNLGTLHQLFHCYLSHHNYIPGPTNAMADHASGISMMMIFSPTLTLSTHSPCYGNSATPPRPFSLP